MRTLISFGIIFLAFTLSVLPLHAGGMLKSGPQKGEMLPGSFHPLNINGPFGKPETKGVSFQRRYHSLVCEYGLRPVVVVFARERDDGKDTALLNLLKELEQAIIDDEKSAFKSFAVFLSPHAQSSVTEANVDDMARVTDPFELNAEAINRDELLNRLEKRAEELKNVVITAYPLKGPNGYNLSDQAEITVLLYHRHKVLANFAFAPDQLPGAHGPEMVNHIRATVGWKKTG
jgi:hypothetical protein